MQEKDSGVKDLSGAGDGADEISGATNVEKGSCLETSGRGFLESKGKNRERADVEGGFWCRGLARSWKVCSFIGMDFL